jgi:hypothetical protein
MNSRPLNELQNLEDARFHPGADASLIDSFESDHGLVLPKSHGELLQWSNGAEAYGGYLRLFGLYTMESIDSVIWNQPDNWKFAWGDRCSNYWCFGETAWGDQYAYSLGSLRAKEEAKVYFLTALSMTPQIVASSFDEFLEKEFIRSAKSPYDVMTRQARQKLGPLEMTYHLVYVPSVLLSGTEDINHVHKMHARSAMICNGDIATQLDSGPPDRAVKAVQAYEDELHRTRIRLVWVYVPR